MRPIHFFKDLPANITEELTGYLIVIAFILFLMAIVGIRFYRYEKKFKRKNIKPDEFTNSKKE